MKRDLELVRELLLALENEQAHFDSTIPLTIGQPPLALPGRSNQEIAYHIRIMTQGDLISMGGIDDDGVTIHKYYGFRWAGHEFLDDVRDPEIWRKTKAAAGKVGGASIGFIWEIAKLELKTKLGLP